MSAMYRTVRRGLAVAAVATAALTATVGNASAGQHIAHAGADRGCQTRVAAMTWNANAVLVEGLLLCTGPVTQTLTMKRNGTIYYQATITNSPWTGAWSAAPNPVLPIGFVNHYQKQFGQCVRGAAYQVVVTYSTSHSAFVAPYSGVISTGAPRVLC